MELVILPFHDYKKWINEGYRTRDAHLYQHFEKDPRISKILIVNRPVSLAEQVIKRKKWDDSSGVTIKKTNHYQINQITNKTYIIDFYISDFLKVLVQRKKWWETAYKNKIVYESINEAFNILDFNKPNLFLQNPMSVSLNDNLKTDKMIFDTIDNWLHHPQMQKQKQNVERSYKYINSEADCVFTVSKALTNLFPDNNNVYWIPNGVDLDFFKNAQKYEFDKNRVRIGYVGKIQERVDLNLLEKVAKEFPSCKIVMYGPIYSNKIKIKKMASKYANLEFYGDIHYNDLPDKLKDVDVALVPHEVSSFTNSMNPLKIYEYLASGKPVVTTNIAGVNDLSNYVFVSKNSTEFLENIRYVLKNLQEGNITVGKVLESIAKDISWESKSNRIIDKIDNL